MPLLVREVVMLEPRRAAVRPRVYSPHTGDAMLLEEEVRSLLEAGATGVMRLVGGPGSGRSTALCHLAHVFAGHAKLTLLDADDAILPGRTDALIVRTCAQAPARTDPGIYVLAPWDQDELIEYLRSVHPAQCATVLNRLKAAGRWEPLRGLPELWVIVLDEMAASDPPADIRAALFRRLEALCQWPGQPALVRRNCLLALLPRNDATEPQKAESQATTGEAIRRLVRHRPVQVLFGAQQLADDLRSSGPYRVLTAHLPFDLIKETATHTRSDDTILDRLRDFVAGSKTKYHAMSASLLHAARIEWQPSPGKVPELTGAYLSHAVWPGILLPSCKMEGADLSHADLAGACLDRATARAVRLAGANLRKASLVQITASGADLAGADLREVLAFQANLESAKLEAANLEQADLSRCNLSSANLTGAKLASAKLCGADLRQAQIEDADFTGADLTGALLAGLKLEEACFTGAQLAKADLTGSNLEGMAFPEADFSKTKLDNALLTGTIMPGADFRGASLRQAGLAEVEWPNAILRDADLKGASFHLGSTRSGLVGSPIASEGTRTGFYTDDYNDRDFKSPEEIRKANLCAADLRGANIESVDFYLVDLRGALFDPTQEQHLRASGAILD